MTVDEGRTMDEVLERLCTALDEELERQETVLSVCHAQYAAARAQRIDALNAKTQALELLIRDTVRAQQVRVSLFRRVVDAYAIPVERQTMTGLIAVTPEPWSARLKHFQLRLRNVLEEIRAIVHANATLLRSSKRTVEHLLTPFNGTERLGPAAYDARGNEPALVRPSSTLINQRG